MPLSEQTVNVAIARLLCRMSQNWTVSAERTGLIRENSALQIDILVETKGHPPVVIENEFLPASTVDLDATARLGLTLDRDGSPITEAIALRTPRELRECATIDEAEILIHTSNFEYALISLISEDGEEDRDAVVERSPIADGTYFRGSLMAFANFIKNASFSTHMLRRSISELDLGVRDSIGILQDIAETNNELKAQLANLLMQAFSDDDIQQGLGIAVTVVINAALFQEQLAAQYPQVLSIGQMHGRNLLNQAGFIEQWKRILEINYWPIYSIAVSVMESIEDPYIASRFVQRIFQTTQRLVDLGVVDTHDLCGVVFQRFMTERKFLASFYTRPESATLLSHLAIPDLDWKNVDVYRNFKIRRLCKWNGHVSAWNIPAHFAIARNSVAVVHKMSTLI